ncbi:MAG TPA: peptidoglycan-binding protein [Kofleriaceae bacterium]|nr:peptidoglycan-binding protein [Kofleriaceae bacterium]
MVGEEAQLGGGLILQQGSTGAAVKKLQQRLNAKQVAEPPLKIDGNFDSKTEAAVIVFQNSHKDRKGNALEPNGIVGPETWDAINDVRATPEIATTDDEIGNRIVAGMNRNNHDPHDVDRGVYYDFGYKSNFPDRWKGDYSNGLADPQYFERIGRLDWRLKPRMSASAGLQAWLHGLTIAECNSAIVAIQTDAVRAAIGDTKFDERFGSTDQKIAEDKRMRIKAGVEGTVVDGLNKPTEGAAAGDAGTFGNRPIQKGDWCYFCNHPKYLLKHPGGAFQGENAIFMGTDTSGKQIWSGMGVDNVTEQDMLREMISAYNTPRDDFDRQALERIKVRNGGVLPSPYDESSGEFPDMLTSPADILHAPAYEIDGTTRKGGFVPDSPSRLETTKVAALAT